MEIRQDVTYGGYLPARNLDPNLGVAVISLGSRICLCASDQQAQLPISGYNGEICFR
jgi:hypothetical protein